MPLANADGSWGGKAGVRKFVKKPKKQAHHGTLGLAKDQLYTLLVLHIGGSIDVWV
jgi:hypothetical protein